MNTLLGVERSAGFFSRRELEPARAQLDVSFPIDPTRLDSQCSSCSSTSRFKTQAEEAAIRLKRGQRLQGAEPGDVIQIDHLSVPMSAGPIIKHFNAVCTVSHWNVAEAFTAASARSAKNFINKLIEESPFPIRQIQVDGGNEFMSEFEEECEKKGFFWRFWLPSFGN